MPKFMIEASYTPEVLRGLQRDKASGRREAVSTAFAAVSGKLEAIYYTLGEDDVVVIADLPDYVSAAAISASGLVRTKTTALLTVEEIDKALAKSTDYRPPGR
jgi:uncharacterized protein with GYD domain